MKTTRSVTVAAWLSACMAVSPLLAQEPVGERVTFQTEDKDKVTIVGDFYAAKEKEGEKPPVVILLHMYKSNRAAWKPLIPELHKKGLSALAIDLRGHGESIEPAEANLVERVNNRDKDVYEDMKYDVYAAYTWLAEQDKVDLSRFGLVGATVGCTVAFKYAAKDPSVDAVVTLSPGVSYMRIKSTPDVKKITGRSIWLVTPEADTANAETLKKANEAARIKPIKAESDDPDLNIIGTNMFGQVNGIERAIAGYLAKFVGDPAEELVVHQLKRKYYLPPDHKKVESIPLKDKRYLSSPEEAENRGLKLMGTPTKEGGASGAIDA